MGLPTSGQISMKDIIDEKKGNTASVVNVSMQGMHLDGVVDDGNVDRALNTDSIQSAAHGGPDGAEPHSIDEFYGYDQDFVATSFNGTGPGSVSSFTTNTSTSVNTSSGFLAGQADPGLDLNTSTFKSATFWEMNNNHSRGNSPAVQSNSTASIRIGNDKTNKRIMLLLLKDGDADAAAGAGNNAGYILVPYVNLENATWTYTYEYDTSTQGYSSANSDIGVFRGNPGLQGTFTTSSTYRTIPSNTGGTYASIPGFTGMAATGESLYSEGSSSSATWTAKVPSNENNIKVSVGKTSFHSGSVGVRVRIKAVDGSDTYTALSNYWTLSLSAQRGFGV